MSEAWRDSMERAERAWRARWDAEEPEEKPRMFRYVITIECTFETWQSVMTALKGFPLARRSYHQEEL